MEKKIRRKRKKRKNERAKEEHFGNKFLSAHTRTLEASGTEGLEEIYSDCLISFKPDDDQRPVRKEMTKWKEY